MCWAALGAEPMMTTAHTCRPEKMQLDAQFNRVLKTNKKKRTRRPKLSFAARSVVLGFEFLWPVCSPPDRISVLLGAGLPSSP